MHLKLILIRVSDILNTHKCSRRLDFTPTRSCRVSGTIVLHIHETDNPIEEIVEISLKMSGPSMRGVVCEKWHVSGYRLRLKRFWIESDWFVFVHKISEWAMCKAKHA